jgi:hypothetical protein
MKRLYYAGLAIAASLVLAACGVTGAGLSDPGTASTIGAAIDATGAKAPAPLAGTINDEQVVATLIVAADGIASGVDVMVAGGVLVPGTPTALTVKAALVQLRKWLPVAAAAQKAGNAESYAEAMRETAKAFLSIKSALK